MERFVSIPRVAWSLEFVCEMVTATAHRSPSSSPMMMIIIMRREKRVKSLKSEEGSEDCVALGFVSPP